MRRIKGARGRRGNELLSLLFSVTNVTKDVAWWQKHFQGIL